MGAVSPLRIGLVAGVLVAAHVLFPSFSPPTLLNNQKKQQLTVPAGDGEGEGHQDGSNSNIAGGVLAMDKLKKVMKFVGGSSRDDRIRREKTGLNKSGLHREWSLTGSSWSNREAPPDDVQEDKIMITLEPFILKGSGWVRFYVIGKKNRNRSIRKIR